METNVSLGVYSWYKQVQKKDLGVTRKDWLQYLREQARNKQQKNDTGRCIQDDVAERDKQIEELGKKERDSEFALAGVFKQNTLHVSPTLQEGVKQSTPQNSQKRKNASQNNQNDLEVEKEEIDEKNKKLRYSSTFTPIRSPFSMFLDPGFITPTLVLRKGDNEIPDLSRVSSLYSPTVPISDIYSPGRSIINTTGDVVASLGGNLDDSLVSWTSALATPSAQVGRPPQQVSPSTLERLTLHPRQGLRQNVMARSLFSPCAAAVNSPCTSDEYNPSLGIIKCLSPMPVFINRLTDTLTKKVDNENKEKLLDSETQGFNVSLDRSDMESVEDDNYQKASFTEDKIRRDKIPCEMDNKYPLDTTPEIGKICNAKRPERTSTPVSVTPQSKTSLLPRHLVLSDDLPELLEHYEKAQITQVMQTPERNVNVIEREHTNDLGMLVELDAAEDIGKLSQNPFDLICSPVKKVNCRKSVEVINSDARQKLLKDLNASNNQKVKIVNNDTNIKNPDSEEQLFSTRNIKEIRNTYPEPGLNNRDNKNVNHPLNIDNPTSKKSPPQQNENGRNRSSTEIINEKAEKKVSELKKENCMAKNKCTDNEQFISELKAAPEKSGLSITVHTSHGSLSSPLFKKIPSNYPDSNHACTVSDSTKTFPMPSEPLQTKSILNKLALRKKKYSGKFLYPSKPEESYEKLKMKYTETIGLIGSTKNSLLESEMPTSKTVKASTGKSPPKLLTDIHNIANKQQNFLSLTSLEKDARFETNVIPLLNEKTYSHLGKEKENSSSSGNQEVPLNQEKVEIQQISSRILAVTSLGARNAVSNESVLKLDQSLEEPCEKFIEERFSINTDPNTSTHDTNKISEDLTKMFDDKQKKGEETHMLISELQVVPQRELTKECTSPVSSHNDVHLKNDHLISPQVLMQVGSSQIMDDSLNDVYFSELDINSCVPLMGDRDTRKTDKTKHSCEASLQVIGATSSKCTVESGERYVNDCWDKKMSGFYTGQGKQMKLSKEALEHAKELLEESPCDKSSKNVFRSPNNEYIPCDSLDRVNANDENHQVIASQSMSTNFPVVCGFMTARGSRVTVNPAALEKAKNLWKEENCATVSNAGNDEVKVTEYSTRLNQTLRNVSESVHDGLTRDRGIIQVQNGSLPSRSFEVCPEESKDYLDPKISDAIRNNIHHSSPLVNKNEPINTLNEKLSKGEFQGFSTASGYKVNISSEALKKAQLLWEENNRDDDHEENNLTINRDRNPRHRSNLDDLSKLQECGKICCTKSTVHFEKQISVCSEGNLNVIGGTGKSGYNSTSLKFKNSEGQDTKFGSYSLLEAENLSCVDSDLVDDDVLEKSITINMKSKLKNDSSPVSHSDQDSVACISHETTNTDHVNDCDKRYQQTEEKNLLSFKTASGRRIPVNETALVRAKKLWDESTHNEIGAGNVTLYPDEKTELILSSRNETLGKEAKVSANQAEESIYELNNTSAVGNAMSSLTEQVNKPLNNTWDEPEPFGFSKEERTKISLDSDPLYAVPGFAIGQGKQVLVSKEALCKAKQILSEDLPTSDVREVSIFTEQFTCSKKSIMKFEGFSTAGGNKIQVSQSALLKAQKFLTEENVDEKQINIESEKETSSNKCNIQNYSVPPAGIIGHLVLGNKGEPSNSACRETETIPPLLAHFSESRDIQETGKHIMEENVLSDTPQDRTLEASVVNILVNETRKTDKNNDASKGTRQNLLGKTKLSSSAETPDLQPLIENKIKNDFGKDTPNILKVLKETNCRTENGTEESSDTPFINAEMNGSSYINTSISRTPESYGIRNKFVDTEGETKDYTQTSSSTALGSQKPNWKDRTNYVDDQSVVNKNTPAQQHSNSSVSPPLNKRIRVATHCVLNEDRNFQVSDVHSHTNSQISKENYSLASTSRLPLMSQEVENHSKGKNYLKSIRVNAPSSDSLEITEITEAFLKDDSLEQEGALEGWACRRKWSQEKTLEKEEEEALEDWAHKRKRSQKSEPEREESSNVTISKRQKILAEVDQIVDERERAYLQGNEEIEAERQMLRLKQINMIRCKDKALVQPVEGSLHKLRSESNKERLKLKSLGTLKVFCGWKKVTAKTALHYQFQVDNNSCACLVCGDGCSVVPDAYGYIGVKQIEQSFLAMPGVDPGLLTPGWVPNHYRWIVWKLASLERRLLNCQVLTVQNVIARLKYRYDREIDHAERPVLRKIMERDDIPQKTMILCVADITFDKQDGAFVGGTKIRSVSPTGHTHILELTDGWYSIGAVVDSAMSQIIQDDKVGVGTKLVIHGAEITGSSAACHPLEAPSTLRLRLHTNMTRRARWWSRLGLLPLKGSLPTLIGATLHDGGLVGQMTVTLARVYPLVYFERSNGRAVFRGEKAHLRILKETQHKKEVIMHQVMIEVEKEFSQETRENSEDSSKSMPSLTREEIRNLTMGRDIAKLMEETMDPSSLEGLLTRHQVELARSWRQHQEEERRRNINAEVQCKMAKIKILYEATPVLKVRIVDRDGAGAMLTVWRPSEELRQTLTEGSHMIISYLLATGLINGCLQFRATRHTRWEQGADGQDNFPEFDRQATPLCLMTSGELKPMWNEVDVAGVVLRVGLLEKGAQIVHIVDHHVNILALRFWGGIKECGVEDIVKLGSIICVSNGSWRGHTGGRFGCIHVTELTVISTSPRSAHLHEAATHLKESIKNMKDLLQEGDMKLDRQFDSRAFPTEPTYGHGHNDSVKSLREEIAQQQPRFKDSVEISKQESGSVMDNGSLSINGEKIADPKLIRLYQRTREVRSKLKTLGHYGTPSALRTLQSPLALGARKPFRLPFKQPQKTDSAENKSE